MMVMDDYPWYCPKCGHAFKWDAMAKFDFMSGEGHTCKCGQRFAYVRTDIIERMRDAARAEAE